MASFGQWRYSVDRDATIAAYAETELGASDYLCDCSGCRNFRLARAQVFPGGFLALLDRLGIDPLKESEVFQYARLAPGRHSYGGWYHFIGTLDETGDFPPVKFEGGFAVYMCHGSAPRLRSLRGLPAVQLEFHTETVPWLLDEEELP